MNQLICKDNLIALQELIDNGYRETVDLCYIDPPFFTQRDYGAYNDKWQSMEVYIDWLYKRVELIYKLLKPTGSMYLHCDWHADAYIRVGILDKVFGMNNFRNEIVWHYDIGHAPKIDFKRKHDTIYRYTKDKKFVFNEIKLEPLNTKRYNLKDDHGRQYFIRGDSGKKCYADEGVPCDDVWTFAREERFRNLNSMSPERIGYPTQKPEALLERIIKASSNEGDVVLDAFVGGGTTIAVANKLNRKWIGIDQSVQAIELTKKRLKI